MLKEKILARQAPIRLYGFSPPKATNAPEKNLEIAARQVERVNALGPDGVVIYDLQDEPGRDGSARPFPFLPTLDPLEYARVHLAGLRAPKIIYRCVAKDDEEGLTRWLERYATVDTSDLAVFVGAPTSAGSGLSLKTAYRMARDTRPTVCLGGVAIAERHLKKCDEHERLLAKHNEGCRFFISQTVYDVQATKSLISDYALRFAEVEIPAPPLIFSFAPCGSLKTMEFMRWLGIAFPRWMENELRHSHDILEKSLGLCVEVAAELAAFARAKGVPAGMNVESISIRKEEIEASLELFRRLGDEAWATVI
jgi:hypothetical protein